MKITTGIAVGRAGHPSEATEPVGSREYRWFARAGPGRGFAYVPGATLHVRVYTHDNHMVLLHNWAPQGEPVTDEARALIAAAVAYRIGGKLP